MIGLVGAGYMGSGLGVSLKRGGHDVGTTLAGRSARTARFVADAAIDVFADMTALVSACDILLVVTPPAAAIDAGRDIAAAARSTQARPLVVDLNAIAPSTVSEVAATLAEAGLDLVDGSISGPPPTVRPGARIFLSGPRAGEVAALAWRDVSPIVVPGPVGQASAIKMCTASAYKGLIGIMTQAVRAADHYGVVDAVLADLGDQYPSLAEVAVAATKAHRYVGEMREIAVAQSAAGLTPALFEAFAEVYADVAATPLADGDPEAVAAEAGHRPIADVMAELRRR